MKDLNPSDLAMAEASTARRNRHILITGLCGVLLLGGVFASLTVHALNVRAITSSEFPQYVRDHNIGRAEISDDASGFQGDFCLLHVNRPIADAQLEAQLFNLMAEYHEMDGGNSLTVEYDDQATGKKTVEGDAVYNAVQKTVQLTMYTHGVKRQVQKAADWEGQDAT